jgi:uncharacterized protein (DUF433 family)
MDASTEKIDFELPPLEVEMYGGEPYEYHPLGKYIVMAPGVCGGRPTFKYTRLEPSVILAYLSTGETVEEVVKDYRESNLSLEAVREAIAVAPLLQKLFPARYVL